MNTNTHTYTHISLFLLNPILRAPNDMIYDMIEEEMWSELNGSESESVLFIQIKLFSVLYTVPKTQGLQHLYIQNGIVHLHIF